MAKITMVDYQFRSSLLEAIKKVNKVVNGMLDFQFYNTYEYIMENPSFIQPTATYPNKCSKFRRKLDVSSDKVCEVCGSRDAKFNIVPDRGAGRICDRCLEEFEGDI